MTTQKTRKGQDCNGRVAKPNPNPVKTQFKNHPKLMLHHFLSVLKVISFLAVFAIPCSLYAIDVNGTGGTPLSYQVVVGGTPTSWAVTSGSLPPGLLLNSLTGVITGVPNNAGSYPTIITATDAGGTTTPVDVTLNISAAPGGSIQFSQAVFTHQEVSGNNPPEPSTTPTLTLTRTGGSSGAVTVSYTVYPSSITSNAVEDTNYYARRNTRKWVAVGRVTWADGDTADKTVPINFLDTLNGNVFRQTLRYNTPGVDGTVRFEARIANLTGTATYGAQSQARFDVLDADAPTAGVLNYDARIFYGAEGSTATITVRRDSGSTGAASVNYATSNTLPVIRFNMERLPSASAGQHYIATTGTLNWAAGDSATKSFTVTLPATGSTAGTLQVGLYLTSPTGAVLGNSASSVLTIQNPKSTLFDFNDEALFAKYRVYVPPGTAPLRGTLFLLSGTFGDTRNEVVLPEFQAVANFWRFAVVGVNGTYDFDPGTGNPDAEMKLGDLIDKLDLIANTTGRPELRSAPVAFSGMSGGGFSASRSFLPWPERTIGVIAHNAWDKLGATYSPLTSLQREVPGLLMPGTADTTVNLFSIGPNINTSRQYGQTRSTMAVKWGIGHWYNYSEAYNGFAFYWFEQMMKAGRYPEGLAPTATTSPVLGSIPLNSGWWGARNSTNSATNGYQISGGSSRFLKIEADAANTLIKDPNNPLVDSWLPTEGVARAYRAQASLQTIQFSAPLPFNERIIGVPTTLSLNLGSYGGSITSVEYFDGTTSLGSTSTAPYTLSWTPANSGIRGITAVATPTSGLPYTTATYVFVPAPAIPFAPVDLHTDNGNGQVTLAWTAISNANSYSVYEASSAVGPFTLVQSGITSPSYVRTGRTNGTTYFYKVTSTNTLGTSSDSRVVRATPSVIAGLPIIQESFSYTVPSNNPDPDGGLNNNNGLPASNVAGGNPSGTSNGMRGSWGISTDVIAGLSYNQGTKTLTTTGGAARINNATWGGNPYFYQNMATDPHLAQRVGNASNGNFGPDGSSIYLSFLAQTSSSTANAFNFSLRFDGQNNFFIGNTTTGWSLNGINATAAPLALDSPALMIVRIDFSEGPTDRVSLWVNPPLGQPLGNPNAIVQNINFPGISNVQTRAFVANAMIIDELRMGTSLAAVTPFIDTGLIPVVTADQIISGSVSSALNFQIAASNMPTSYALASGSLPPGITLNTTTGLLSGTPAMAGTFTPSFTATNGQGTSSTRSVSITILDALLTGTVSGSTPYQNNATYDANKVFDGNTTTFFAPEATTGSFAQIDLGQNLAGRVSLIRYIARSTFTSRMVGGVFQGSNNATSWTTLHTVVSDPGSAWQQITISDSTFYRYLRYQQPINFGDVAEVEFRGVVQSTGSSLVTFRTANGLAADGSQDLLTPAGDGVANLLKYAFNMLGAGSGQATSLSTPNASVLAANGTAGLPLVGVESSTGKLQLTYIRRKSATAPGITYAVEFSDALATWAVNASATESVTSIDTTFERVTVTDSFASPAKRFVRVRVSISNP